jgi:hypothetical protein
MKILARLVALLALAPFSLGAADRPAATRPAADPVIAAVTAADDERLAATVARDRARLEAVFSDDLHYAHSSGHADTKASYITALTTSSTRHDSYDYQERTFTPAAPGVVLMTGRVLAHSSKGEQKSTLDLSFLAVWREEHGHWRFLAWQSCANPPAVAPAAK